MFRIVPSGRSRHIRTMLIAVALLGLLGMVVPAASSHVGSPPAPIAAHTASSSSIAAPAHLATSHAAAPSQRSTLSTKTLPTHPSISQHPAGSGTGSFWVANSSWSQPAFINEGCSTYSFSGYFDSSCYNQSVQPTLLTLANGDLGISYSVNTNSSSTSCTGSATSVKTRVGFAVSSNGGLSFGASQYLGNDSSCKYLDAIEPSFAVAADGTIYGVYVEDNYSNIQGTYTARSSYFCCGNTNDALGFTMSTDNGTTFSAPVTIQGGGNISKPQIAVFGNSVYILYENISNGTSTQCFGWEQYYFLTCTATPISENLLFSSNRGATWTGPKDLPALNATSYDDALGGSIAVNATGTVGVAYFTDNSCFTSNAYDPSFYTCWTHTDDLVYTTSTNNGTSWKPLITVQAGVGESQFYPDGYNLAGHFQVIPQAKLIYDAAGTTAYIVWGGTYNKSALGGAPFLYYDEFSNGGIFAAIGPSSGSAFTVSDIQVPISNIDYDDFWNPSVAVSAGTIYISYTQSNETYCSGAGCPALDGAYAEWLRTSTDGGVTWSDPLLLGYSTTCNYGYCQTYNAAASFGGFCSSIGFNGAGAPIVAYALPYGSESSYQYVGGTSYYNYSYPTQLFTAMVWTGPTVTVNFTENNVAVGQSWGFSLSGNAFSTTNPYFDVTNVPLGQTVSIVPGNVAVGYGTQSSPVLSVPGSTIFRSNETVYINYSLSYLLSLSIEPTNPEFAEITFTSHSGSYYYYEIYTNCPPCTTPYNSSSSYSWYFPANSTLELNSTWQYGPFSYWTGTGLGSFTGPGAHANITFNAPINETGWLGGFGSYNVSVVPVGLSASTTFHFDLDGTAYSGPGNKAVNVSKVGTGAHQLTNAWASSTTAGWEYFGTPSPADPVIVPAETSVSLDFALVDVAASIGTVTFHAQGLTAGTVWNFEFNGTTYSSDTPWINISSHPGTFPVHAFNVVSENASVGYTPSGVASTWAVTTGSTYLVDYVPAYRVLVEAGTGGGVTGGTGSFWLAAGASTQFIASAHAGYGFGGWTGTGLGSYTGLSSYANLTVNGPIVQTASFFPLPSSRFNLTFTETGLAPGTWWTIFLGGTGFSSNGSTFLVANLLACGSPAGNYNLTIPYAYSSTQLIRYVPTSHLPKVVCTNGATVEEETFAAQFLLTLQSTEGGFAQAQIGPGSFTTSEWVASGASVALSAVGQTGYDFLGWNGTGNGNYTGPGLTQGIIMAAPITELATFQLHVNPAPPTFTITFHEQQTLAAGTVWGILFGGTGYSSTSATLAVSGLTAQTYPLTVTPAYSPDGLTRYTTLGNVPSVTVAHNATVLISYTTSYWVSVSGTPGGTTTPGSSWVTSGGSIFLNVTVLDGYTFVGWMGTGAASYTGLTAGDSLTVSSPVSEVATFAPVAKTVTTTSGGGSALWTEPTTWIGLGVVGLVVGLIVGLVVSRRGGRPPAAASSYQGPPPTSDGGSPPEGGPA